MTLCVFIFCIKQPGISSQDIDQCGMNELPSYFPQGNHDWKFDFLLVRKYSFLMNGHKININVGGVGTVYSVFLKSERCH